MLKGYLEKDFKDLEISNNDSFFGSKNLNENTISIGRDLSNILGLDIGDEVSITSPSGVQTLVGSLPKQKLFLITSIFESGLSEYDENIAYINLKSLLIGKPKIENVRIQSNETDIKELKKLIKYFKPSNFKRFVLNDIERGKINSSFIYSINKSGGEIDNIRGLVNGFQISSGNISFSNSKLLEINGNLISDLNLNKKEIDIFIEKENLNEFENLNLIGKINSSFKINFDQTLKIIDYELEAKGGLKKGEIKFKRPKEL